MAPSNRLWRQQAVLTATARRCRRRVGTALLTIPGLLALSRSPALGYPVSEGRVFEGPVPRAQCGPGSRPEPALQGEVTVADRASGRSSQGYTCNLAEV